MPHFYPVFLNLEHLSVLIVGFGSVGQRKFAMLLEAAPAFVRILDPARPSPEGSRLLETAKQRHIAFEYGHEPFDEGHLEQADLVFTCSSDHALNARIADLCRRHRKLCNCTDNPPAGNFHVPAVARAESLAAALSTDRASPALARRWKTELEHWLAPKAPLARLMGRLRPLVLSLGLPSDQNRDLFRTLSSKELEDILAASDPEAAATFLNNTLPEPLRVHIPALLAGL